MTGKRVPTNAGWLVVPVLLLAGCQADDVPQEPGPVVEAVPMDGDDIAGTVVSAAGPEAGVWVIAETEDFDTRFVAKLCGDGLEVLAASRDEHEVGAGLGKQACRRCADAFGPARDDHGLAFEDHSTMVSEARANPGSSYFLYIFQFLISLYLNYAN